ncbi:hypothetical protein L6452_25185 [Arctium lappa]|uniref:Uncharacterized protein n=1 Tax=Arctium lappa TaxID=4217 RepID=A0ACB9A9X1_ARCLA|nr:hypothetical protein L6452_25185 [Arctium lappa]
MVETDKGGNIQHWLEIHKTQHKSLNDCMYRERNRDGRERKRSTFRSALLVYELSMFIHKFLNVEIHF